MSSESMPITDLTNKAYSAESIIAPIYDDWVCRLSSLHFRPVKGNVPNRFHRFMQKLILGIEWTYHPVNSKDWR